MAVPAVNIVIQQGTDYFATFTITNPDETAYSLANTSAVARLRKYPEDQTSYPFSTSLIVSTGKITISMGNTVTSELDLGRYYYNITLTNNTTNLKTRVIEGMALVT